MKYTKEIKYTKNGRELPRNEIAEAKAKQKSRINPSLQCPMNWLEQWLDRIPGSSTSQTTPTLDFFLKMNGKPNNRQMTRIRSLIENYDLIVKSVYASESDEDRIADRLLKESALLLEELKKIKIRNPVTINRLIETALGLSAGSAGRKTGEVTARYTRKMLNCLYRTDRERFLQISNPLRAKMPNQTVQQNRNPLILQGFPRTYNRCNMEGPNTKQTEKEKIRWNTQTLQTRKSLSAKRPT